MMNRSRQTTSFPSLPSFWYRYLIAGCLHLGREWIRPVPACNRHFHSYALVAWKQLRTSFRQCQWTCAWYESAPHSVSTQYPVPSLASPQKCQRDPIQYFPYPHCSCCHHSECMTDSPSAPDTRLQYPSSAQRHDRGSRHPRNNYSSCRDGKT